MTYRAIWLALAISMIAACTSTASLTDAELSQAATQGDGRAQYELARRLANQPDYPNAMHWMQQAAEQSGPLAADQQIRASAARQVGDWYQRAATAGSTEAELWLGMTYLAGEQVSADPALGRYWLELAAGHGSHEAEYQLSLQQVNQKPRVYWLEKAANGGIPKALFELAELHVTACNRNPSDSQSAQISAHINCK